MKLEDYRTPLAAVLPQMIDVRRRIHQNPELAFEEHATSDLVAGLLTGWGYSVHRGIAGTGLVAQLKVGDGTKAIGIRADMDALPIVETTALAWASRRIGTMHACGHDGHTATLLAAARHLAESRRFNGTLNLIFQPAEEGAGGGKRMVDEGLFTRFPCDAIFALHNAPGVPVGTLAFRTGAAMASMDSASITVHGKGGHGAMPHSAADPIVAASAIVMALQTLVSRNVDPVHTAVVTVGAFHAGNANNVIPQTAQLELTIRSLDRDVRTLLRERLHALVTAQAQSFGVRAEIAWCEGYPVLVNTAAETAFAAQVGIELVGADKVLIDPPPVTGSEDFAFMLEHRPGCYLLMGNGDNTGDGAGSCMVHNPGYDFNDAAMETGAAYWSLLAERFLV